MNNLRYMLLILVTPLLSCATNQHQATLERGKTGLQQEKTIASLDSAQLQLEDIKLDVPTLNPDWLWFSPVVARFFPVPMWPAAGLWHRTVGE